MDQYANIHEPYPPDVHNSFLITDDLKFKPKVRSLDDLTGHVHDTESYSKTVNEKNLNDKKLFAKNSIKKQLQFKLSREPTRDKMPMKKKLSESSGNLHDQLNKLKSDEIKKRRIASIQSIKSNSDHSSLKNFKKKLNSFKSRAYCVLERPTGLSGLIYRIFIFTLVFGSILIGALTTIKSFGDMAHKLMFAYELFVTAYFSLEFLIRFWCVDQRLAFKGFQGKLRFIFRPIQLIELTLIVISVIILSTGYIKRRNFLELGPEALSALKFFQIFRFLYIDRQAQTWVILTKVIKQHRFELLSCVYIAVIILLFSSYLILYFEKPFTVKNDDNQFLTYADAIYWSIITMTTIGYGDRSPRTFAGKIVSTTLCIVGVAFWTLPGGIIGSGFALKVEQKNKKKQFNRLLPAAAGLIQSWWRMKATLFLSSSNLSSLIATVATFDLSKPIYSTSLRRLKNHLDSFYLNNDNKNLYFAGLDSPQKNKLAENGFIGQEIKETQIKDETLIDENSKFLNPKNFYGPSSSAGSNYSHTSREYSILMKLSPEHLLLIRTILILKFFRAKQKFKLAFKPYDFKDVIEQYTQGNMDILLKMKDLQRKIDQMNNFALNRSVNYDFSPNSPSYAEQKNNSAWPKPGEVLRRGSNRRSVRKVASVSPDSHKLERSKQDNPNDPQMLNERVERIEIILDNLSSKIDRLLDSKI